jgi:hypothetical protein
MGHKIFTFNLNQFSYDEIENFCINKWYW